jgi:hypothetical protein
LGDHILTSADPVRREVAARVRSNAIMGMMDIDPILEWSSLFERSIVDIGDFLDELDDATPKHGIWIRMNALVIARPSDVAGSR